MATPDSLQPIRTTKIQSFWMGGMNSNLSPLLLSPTTYQCSFNTVHRGGIVSVRPRHRLALNLPGTNPQMLCFFTPTGAPLPIMVAVGDGIVYTSAYPYTDLEPINALPFASVTASTPISVSTIRPHGYVSGAIVNITGVTGTTEANGAWTITVTGINSFTLNGSTSGTVYSGGGSVASALLDPTAKQCFGCVGQKSVKLETSGALTLIPTQNILLISDGASRVIRWDGIKPPKQMEPQPPVFGVPAAVGPCVFSNGRLWAARGAAVYASDLNNPDTFTETLVSATGGFIAAPGDVTGMIEAPDRSGIFVFTSSTAFFIKSSLRDRTQWQIDPTFIQSILPGIGCSGPKAVANQFGLTYFFSPGGLLRLDTAIQTYRTSNVVYEDVAMERSKGNLSPDRSKVCIGTHEDYLFCSVPSGDVKNRHTWCLDENPSNQSPRAWSSIWTGTRPVEYANAVIQGKQRTFFLSQDYHASGGTFCHVWEMFGIGQAEPNGPVVANMETSLFQVGPLETTAFVSAEIFLVGLEGNLRVRGWVGNNAGGYLPLLDTTLDAPRGPYSPTWTSTDNNFLMDDYRPQSRIVTTPYLDPKVFAAPLPDAVISQVQEGGTQLPLGHGRTVNLLLELTGVGAVQSIRLMQDTKPDRTDAKCSPAETINSKSPLSFVDYNTESNYYSL